MGHRADADRQGRADRADVSVPKLYPFTRTGTLRPKCDACNISFPKQGDKYEIGPHLAALEVPTLLGRISSRYWNIVER